MSLFDVFRPMAPSPMTVLATQRAAEDDVGRAAAIARRWRAYNGQHPRPLTVRPGQADDNVIVNLARTVVDKGVSFLFGQDVAFELPSDAPADAERWLVDVWRANRQATFLQQMALSGAVAGHVFVKLVPAAPYPRLVLLDPATVTVRWDYDDITRVEWYRIQYPAIDPQTGKALVRRQVIERDGVGWRVTDQRSDVDARDWIVTGETTWPWSWPPVVDCQNLPAPHEYWGMSDIEDDLLALNHACSFVLSNLARIVRYHAHPRTWGRGFAAQQLNTAVDETIVLPSPDAELRNLEMTSDLSSSIALYQRLREALLESARIPEVATGKLESAGALSGVALNILYQPLIEKTQAKRRTYGDLLVELNRRLLALGGFGEENVCEVHWPDLLPGDPKAAAETALLQQQLGVSRDTLLERLGFDPDLEREKRDAGATEMGNQLLTAFERGQQ
jgi:hypothetical protein